MDGVIEEGRCFRDFRIGTGTVVRVLLVPCTTRLLKY